MAFLLYKKFFKKSPIEFHPCEHQLAASDLRIETLSNDGLAADSDINKLHPDKLQEKSKTLDASQCTICKDEKRRMSVYRWKLMIGLLFPFLVQSLDATMIAGAVPFIASDFHQLSQLNWIISAFNLTAAAFIPFWGQLADIFGRYTAIQSATLSMLLGSILCSVCPTTAFPLLLLGRAFQGVGCAGLMIVTKVVLADKVSLKDNATNNTIFTIVGGIGYGIGPTLGGHLTQVNWRWCFIINIPFGVIGLVFVHFLLRPELVGAAQITRTDGTVDPSLSQSFTARLQTIDYIGQLLFLFGIGLLILALTWAGSYYPWSSPKVLAPLIVGILLTILLLIYSYFLQPSQYLSLRSPTRKPMLPIRLLLTRNLGLLIYINLITGMAMYAVYYFISLYFALVKDFSASKSGTSLIYYMPGLAVGAYMAMFACNTWPLQTFFPLILGTILEPLGITILAIALRGGHLPTIYGMLALTGVGTGIRFMPGTLHAIGYFPDHIASVISLNSLALNLGGTLATTIMLNIFNHSLSSHGLSFSSASSSSFSAIAALPASEQAFLREKATDGIVLAFFAITAFMWLGVVACLGLGNVRIGKGGVEDRVVEKGSFVGGLLFRRKERKGAEVEMERV